MALGEYRVFKRANSWWAAYVFGGTGGLTITEESVIFTNLSDPDVPSRAASFPAGSLNRISHRSLVRLLENGSSWESAFPAFRYNVPDPDDYPDQTRYEDEEGLEWAMRRTQSVRVREGVPEVRDAIEVQCLDDSALKKEILLEDPDTYDRALEWMGNKETAKGMVAAVKSTFEELPDEEEQF